MDENKNTEDAVWCVDSETGKRYLIEYKTGQIIAREDDNGNIIQDRG